MLWRWALDHAAPLLDLRLSQVSSIRAELVTISHNLKFFFVLWILALWIRRHCCWTCVSSELELSRAPLSWSRVELNWVGVELSSIGVELRLVQYRFSVFVVVAQRGVSMLWCLVVQQKNFHVFVVVVATRAQMQLDFVSYSAILAILVACWHTMQ